MLDDIKVTVQLASADEVRRINEELAALHQLGESIMTTISDFVQKQNAYNQRVSDALDGVKADIQSVNDNLTKIQNSPGTLSTEDQQALDAALAGTEQIVQKAEALDALTPPTPPAG